jgi:hypothetical protein
MIQRRVDIVLPQRSWRFVNKLDRISIGISQMNAVGNAALHPPAKHHTALRKKRNLFLLHRQGRIFGGNMIERPRMSGRSNRSLDKRDIVVTRLALALAVAEAHRGSSVRARAMRHADLMET